MVGTQSTTSYKEYSTLPVVDIDSFTESFHETGKQGFDVGRTPVTKNKVSDPELKTSTNIVVNNSVDKFKVLAEWTGIVTKVSDSYFKAIVKDNLDSSLSEELVEFDIDDLSERDRKLLQTEAVFYWTVGYQTIHKTKVKASKVVFRHMPPLSNVIMEMAEKEAKQLSNFFSQFE